MLAIIFALLGDLSENSLCHVLLRSHSCDTLATTRCSDTLRLAVHKRNFAISNGAQPADTWPAEDAVRIDRVRADPQDVRVNRIFLLLLLIGVSIGLATQQPAQALAVPAGHMVMAMPGSDTAAMPDCSNATRKIATHLPCKCGTTGCIAMTMSGASILPADATGFLTAPMASDRGEYIGISPVLRGRSTAPEPEPPSHLI